MHLGPRRGLDAWFGYGPEEFTQDFGGHKVIASVYVECGWTAGAAGEVRACRASILEALGRSAGLEVLTRPCSSGPR